MNNIKKVYPSQINTKSLACRVPASDYVEFLQDAINKGINLNDWLLMRVYGNKPENQSISGIKEKDKKMLEYLKNNFNIGEQGEEENPIWGIWVDDESWWIQNQKTLERIIENSINPKPKMPSILDAKTQLAKIAKEKLSARDYRDFLEQMNELLEDIS